MKKTDVNGKNALPVFIYLKSQKGFTGLGKGMNAVAMNTMLKVQRGRDDSLGK